MSSLLLLPPLLLDLLLFTLFAKGLRPGGTAILTTLARRMRGHELDAKTVRYSRRVSMLWALCAGGFAVVILQGLVIQAWRPVAVYAALVQGSFYLVLLAVEYQVRRRYLTHLEHPGFRDFLRFLRRVDYLAILRE